MKIVGTVVVAIAVLVGVGCGGDDGAARNAARIDAAGLAAQVEPATPGATAPAQGITVVGTGSVTSVPDVAEWSLGVHSRADTAAEALRESSAAMKRLLTALGRAGLERDDLRTEHVSLWPDMGEDASSVLGYTASNSVRATVRTMKDAGAVVDAAVAAGANEVYGPTLRVADTRAQFEKAAAAALEDARRKADAIAASAGATLGAPVAIAEAMGGDIYYADRLAAAPAEAEVPIEPGERDLEVTLTVTFAIS